MTTDLGPGSNAFLEQMPNLVLGTIRRNGSPQASPVWYLWTGSSFLVSTIEATAEWQNPLRDRHWPVCVDNPQTGQMIVAYGKRRFTRTGSDSRPISRSRSITRMGRREPRLTSSESSIPPTVGC